MRKVCGHIPALILAATPLALAAPATPAGANRSAGTQRDGSHDFDWDIGAWKTYQRRRLHPLTGSNEWVDYHGTDRVRSLWQGANTGMIEADGPAGHLEIFTIRLYNPASQQWTVSFTNPAAGTLGIPLTGEFKHGRAEFYDQEPYKGRQILVRFAISDITASSCRFEQSFSDDGGKTWEVNFIVTETRMKGDAARGDEPGFASHKMQSRGIRARPKRGCDSHNERSAVLTSQSSRLTRRAARVPSSATSTVNSIG